MKRPWLAPLTPLYAAGVALRELRLERGWEPVKRLGWPVISIGNLSTGGSGKTPLTIALAGALTERGLHVDVLSRGYGRTGHDAARVDPDGDAEEFGDEPLLIAREAGVPVYVAAQRYQAGLMAEAVQPDLKGPTVHLLDDGFQHRQLHRDVDALLLDRSDWHGNLLPVGNLRETRKAVRRATILAIPADDPEFGAELEGWGWHGPVWRLRRSMEVPDIDGAVLAFCGIARPEQFFAGLEDAGLHLAGRISFPDHHRYTLGDLNRLVSAARKSGAKTLVSTEKDLVRLGKLTSTLSASLPLRTVGLRIEIENQNEAMDWLAARVVDVSDNVLHKYELVKSPI
ncbi:MAG: tetraacyldisaccharide 4'-kinase [Terracidiphilus sp.]